MKIELYDDSQKDVWDDFVKRSKNGTFLLQRDYMEYHRDLFRDYSFLIRDENDALYAILPAHRNGNALVSHGGLSYAGFVTDEAMTVPGMLGVFDSVMRHLKENGFEKFIYKTIPHIYHIVPAEEDKYALFLCGAALTRRDVLAVVDQTHRVPFQERRRRSVSKAVKNALRVERSQDFQGYWEIVQDNLRRRYNAAPVHNVKDITLLNSRFPENIKLFACRKASAMMGGVVVYESRRVAHVQYISACEEGKKMGAIDLIFDHLLGDCYRNMPFFDFGISNEKNGLYLNRGLIDQKEGFGARAVAHDHYELAVSRWEPGLCARAMELH
ncbi:MAG: GNAT family N-acetyltransferase [Candidatus Aureabacteria bacterium]|nr:GNAT family N-acetyltransferase [Candidatus Auribacterota bacterium]